VRSQAFQWRAARRAKQRHDSDGRGFARPTIRTPGFITPHLTQGKKIARDLAPHELRELWENVVAQVQAQGLQLSVFAELPPDRTPATPVTEVGGGRGRR
jgi:hypothetical protein